MPLHCLHKISLPDCVKLDIISSMTANADQALLRQAKKFYEDNAEAFKIKESVVYELTADGRSETVTADREQLDFMGKADMALADFLEAAEAGDTYEDVQNERRREVLVKEVHYAETDFEANPEAAAESYIRTELLPQLIEKIAKNNQAEFKPDN